MKLNCSAGTASGLSPEAMDGSQNANHLAPCCVIWQPLASAVAHLSPLGKCGLVQFRLVRLCRLGHHERWVKARSLVREPDVGNLHVRYAFSIFAICSMVNA